MDHDSLDAIGFYTLSDERAKRVARGGVLPLSRCEILLGARCNFRCPYCRHVGGPDASRQSVWRTIALWAERGLGAIRFSGGEPTMWPHLEAAVALARKFIHRVAISTNGSAPWETYERLLEAGANDFSVSLDACCASDGNAMAGREGVWDTVVENIKRLAARTYVTVGIVLTEQNRAELQNIVRFAASLGVADIRPIPAAQEGGSMPVGELPQEVAEGFPILKWRWGRLREGLPVRGIGPRDCRRCSLVLDDMAVMGDKHYPCIIYLREGGNPIGTVGRKMMEERRRWHVEHDSSADPICSKNCLDFCVAHNNRVGTILR